MRTFIQPQMTNPLFFIQKRIDEKVKEMNDYKLSTTTSHTDEYQRRNAIDYHKNHRNFHCDERWEGGPSIHEDEGDAYVWYER